jgi:hypothetical protein
MEHGQQVMILSLSTSMGFMKSGLTSVTAKCLSHTSSSSCDMVYILQLLIVPRLQQLSLSWNTSRCLTSNRNHPCLNFIILYHTLPTTLDYSNPRYANCYKLVDSIIMHQLFLGSISLFFCHGLTIPAPENAQTCHASI